MKKLSNNKYRKVEMTYLKDTDMAKYEYSKNNVQF